MRTLKKDIWEVVLFDRIKETNILVRRYKTLKDIALELDLSYAQVAELTDDNGRVQKKHARFKNKLFPDITIKRIGMTDREMKKHKQFNKEAISLGKIEIC